MDKKKLVITDVKVSDLLPDDKNFNKGSEYGQGLIEKSFQKFGAGRSILLDKNNKIIAGNKSTENYGAIGGEDVIVVESDGSQLIAVKRTDIDLDTPQGREMALADNATAKANIVWAEDVIASELGVEVAESWGVDHGKSANGAGDDPFNDDGITAKNQYGVIVMCESAGTQESVFNDLVGMGFNCKIVVV